MNANLLTLTKETREFPMKRLLMPATALSMKKVAFAILGCALLMFIGAPLWAQTISDYGVCNSALESNQEPPDLGTATGCGALITVTSVDGSGKATAFTVQIPNNNSPANGNPYDGAEATLIGIINNSNGALRSITLSSTDITSGGIFAFDGDGPCNYLYATFSDTGDCYGAGGYPYPDPGDYQGPSNTFSNINAVSCTTTDSGLCYTSGTVNFNNAYDENGDLGIPPATFCDQPCNSTWFALEGTPQSLAGYVGPITPVGVGTSDLTPPGTPPSTAVQVTFPTGTSFGTVASMNVVETPEDPATFNGSRFPPACNPSTTSGGRCNGTANTFSGGSQVPPTPYASVQCVPINGKCVDLLYQCFNSNGTKIDCISIVPPQGTLINLTNQFASAQFKNLAMLIATDNQNDWANITTFVKPGDICTKPPCGSGGGTKGLNTEVVLADLTLPCQVLNYTLSPTHGSPGTTINLTGSLKGCSSQLAKYGEKTLFGALFATATFTFYGPLQPPNCTYQTITSPAFPLLVPFGSTLPFKLPVTIPKNACPGTSEVTSSIISGTVTYVGSATLTVP